MVPTVERGLRFVDFWSIETAGERPSMKSTSGLSIWPRNCRAYADNDSTYRRWPSAKIVSNARLDLPEPDRPVNTMRLSRGRSRSTLRRLCSRAPRTTSRSATVVPSPDSPAHARRPVRQLRSRGCDAVRVTVGDVDILENYTGAVVPGGAAQRRTLATLTVTKLSVGPMDNNAYLLTCRDTGEALLIDAANDADRLMDLLGHGPDRPDLRTIVTTHRHADHWQALGALAGATGARTVAHPIDAPELPVPPDRL